MVKRPEGPIATSRGAARARASRADDARGVRRELLGAVRRDGDERELPLALRHRRAQEGRRVEQRGGDPAALEPRRRAATARAPRRRRPSRGDTRRPAARAPRPPRAPRATARPRYAPRRRLEHHRLEPTRVSRREDPVVHVDHDEELERLARELLEPPARTAPARAAPASPRPRSARRSSWTNVCAEHVSSPERGARALEVVDAPRRARPARARRARTRRARTA